MSHPRQLKLSIPPGFAQACAARNVPPQQALQNFIDQLSFYAQLAASPNDTASAVLRGYLDSLPATPAPNPKTRDLNIRYTQEVIALIRKPMRAVQRKKQYLCLIDRWYRDMELANAG